MDALSNSSLELAALRQRLVEAWSENPFPTEKVAEINKALRETLLKYDLAHIKNPLHGRKPLSPEAAARRAAYLHNYWKERKKRRGY